MIAVDNMPLSTTEKRGFKKLMKELVPLYKLPCRNTITQMMKVKYEVLSSIVKTQIDSIEALSLTTDIWSDMMNTRSFLGLTCHFIQNQQLRSITLGIQELDNNHTAEYIVNILDAMFKEWNIKPEKVKAVITDNGANILRAVHDLFGKKKQLSCFAHTMDLVAKRPFEKKGIPEVIQLVQNVKKIVTYFKHCVNAADLLRKAQSTSNRCLKLIQSVCTRWNSTYYQLERFVELAEFIAPILLKSSKAPDMLSAEQLDAVRDLIQILKPLERLSKEISGQHYVTCSKIIPMVYSLRETMEMMEPQTNIGQVTKKVIEEQIKERFGLIEQVSPLAISTILDPRFKKIYFKNYTACAHAIGKITSMLSDIPSQPQSTSHGPITNSGQNNETDDIWRFHQKLVTNQWPHLNGTTNSTLVGLDLTNYFNEPVEDLRNCDPILYWSNHKITSYRKISMIAMDYLCIVGTSVPSERMYSSAGSILTPDRSRLTGKNLQRLLFLKSLDDVYWEL